MPSVRKRTPAVLLSDDDFLTPTDRLLLSRKFEVSEPEAVPGLIDKLPADAAMPQILFRYDVRPNGGMQNKGARPFIRCAHCTGKRHWKGFVIELATGELALLGNTCGKDQFGIEFRRVEQDFHAQRNRQSDLRRIMEIREALSPFQIELETLRYSTTVAAFDGYMSGLRRFGRLSSTLRQIALQRGRVLACKSYDRDREAEIRYAETLPHAKHHRQRIEGAKTDFLRRTRIREYHDWIETLPAIEREKVQKFGLLIGGGIFMMPSNETLAASMRAALDAIAIDTDPFLVARSDYWTKRRLIQAIQMLRIRVGLINRAVTLLTELDRFTSEENLRRIADWSEREVELPQPSIDVAVRARGRTLVDENNRYTLALPESWSIPAIPHTRALLVVLGERD